MMMVRFTTMPMAKVRSTAIRRKQMSMRSG
jgi:hypothetical protein